MTNFPVTALRWLVITDGDFLFMLKASKKNFVKGAAWPLPAAVCLATCGPAVLTYGLKLSFAETLVRVHMHGLGILTKFHRNPPFVMY